MSLSLIGIVNASTRVTNAELDVMVACVSKQLAEDVCPAWGLMPVLMRRFASVSEVPSTPDSAFFVLQDSGDVPGALGWHTEDGADRVTGVICASPVLDSTGGVVLFDPANPESASTLSVASVLSHEAIETVCDQYVNSWAQGPAIAQGSEYAFEACDPVEASAYLVTVDGVGQASLSDFVLPSYFDPNARGKVDFLGVCPGPFELAPGGYYVVRSAPGREQQVFARLGMQRPWRRGESSPAGFRSVQRRAA